MRRNPKTGALLAVAALYGCIIVAGVVVAALHGFPLHRPRVAARQGSHPVPHGTGDRDGKIRHPRDDRKGETG
jgi:hypothetical protein